MPPKKCTGPPVENFNPGAAGSGGFLPWPKRCLWGWKLMKNMRSPGFRLVKGDRLFYTMWEPHQLSALPAALVLALYTAIAGTTTGALLFVRAVVLVCKAAMSAVFYRDFKQTIGRHGALLSAVVLFVYTPKWFLGPDYISQQFHFTVAAFLCFYHYYTHGFRRPWLVVLGAVCACFSFLAFPQSALAAAVIFIGMVLLGPPRQGADDL